MSLLGEARAYVAAGLSIVPCSHRTKRPDGGVLPKDEEGKGIWKPFQSQFPDEKWLKKWFTSDRVKSMAVIGGAISGGLLIIDFDVPGFYEDWCGLVGSLAEGMPVQQTGGGGYQVFLRCPEPGGNQKLAWWPNEKEISGREVAIETRGEGGYALVPPSLHPTGNKYRWVIGGPESIPTVSQAQADALLAAARKLEKAPYTRQEIELQEKRAHAAKPKPRGGGNGQGTVIEQFNARYGIEEMLEKHGYTKRGRYYCRPGAPDRHSVIINGNKSYHFSSNDILSGSHLVDPFDVYMAYEHGGSITDAVRVAAEALGCGYSDQSKSPQKKASGEKKTDICGTETSGTPGAPRPPAPPPEGPDGTVRAQGDDDGERFFWHVRMVGKRSPTPALEVKHDRLLEHLGEKGYTKMFAGGQQESIFVKLGKHVAEVASPETMRDTVMRYVEGLPDWLPGCGDYHFHRDHLREHLIRGASVYFAPPPLQCLAPVEPRFVRDSKDRVYFFYQNGYREITADGDAFLEYETLNGVIWRNQQIPREYAPPDGTEGDFEKFVGLVCHGDQARITALRTALGYLLSRYKNPASAKAVVLLDEKISDDPDGRSGKSLIAQALSKMRNVLTLDGKMVNVTNQFSFQSLELDTDVIVLDDIPKKFPFEQLFHMITGDLEFERKGKQRIVMPFSEAPKFLITTNYTITETGGSAEDRRVEYELHPYFSPSYRPVDEFGHTFFEEWDEAEWRRFDDYMAGCVNMYLAQGLIEPDVVNSNKRKLLQATSKDFVEWMEFKSKEEEIYGKWFVKGELFNEFTNLYHDWKKMEDRGRFSQHTFTRWLKAYARYTGRVVSEKMGWVDGKSQRSVMVE